MKNINIILQSVIFRAGLYLVLLMSFMSGMAQAPTHYPTGNDPVDFTPVNIFFYIVVPVLFVLLYLWWRRVDRKARKKKSEGDDAKKD